MSQSSYFVSEAVVQHFKKVTRRQLLGVSSAHLSESLASALGFNTYAALRAALKGRPTASAEKPSNARLAERLRQLGYVHVPSDLKILPELDRSYTPFRSFPLQRPRRIRWMAWRNMMVAAINAGLEQRLFGLSPGQNWWPGADPVTIRSVWCSYRFVFDGGIPGVASVDSSSGDELSIHVMLDPRDATIEPHSCEGLEDGGAVAHGWLERRLGVWIQDSGEQFSCRRVLLDRVANAKADPVGYADFGSFIL